MSFRGVDDQVNLLVLHAGRPRPDGPGPTLLIRSMGIAGRFEHLRGATGPNQPVKPSSTSSRGKRNQARFVRVL